MPTFKVIKLSPSAVQAQEWDKLVSQAYSYDFYHLSGYHQLAEKLGEGKAIFLAYQEGEYFIGLPLLLRNLSYIEGLERFNWLDATSVYGYAGPVSSHHELPKSVICNFIEKISDYLYNNRIVSVFSRLHPILGNHSIIKDIGEVSYMGETVAINLNTELSEQWQYYSSNHKRNIKKLRRLKARVFLDKKLAFLEKFWELYTETMQRVKASNHYFFSLDYFKSLFNINNTTNFCSFHLFLCEIEENIVSGGIFSECNGIVQYHLGATANVWLKYAPLKLVFDEVRLWAYRRGNRWFHLGGGVGATQDSLFRFKAGFSPIRFPFYTWKWIIRPKVYETLVRARQNWYESLGKTFPSNKNFFPKYRQ